MVMTDDHGTIPVAGRFQRIEDALDRIEDKLDQKVGMREFNEIEARLAVVEDGTNPVMRLLLEQLKGALTEARMLDTRVSALETRTSTATAVQQALESSQANASRLRMVVVGMVVNALIAGGGIVVQVIKAIHGS